METTRRMGVACILLLFCIRSISAMGPLRLPSVFSDHMVLQRGKPVPVWGMAAPNQEVTVRLEGQTYRCHANEQGEWILYIPERPAGGPYSMSVSSLTDRIELKDVYVGEVWLASGQSNMAWTMKGGVGINTEKEIAEADYPLIRYFNVPNETHITPIKKWNRNDWKLCTPQHAADFSAVAYFFAKELFRDMKIPIGIINASWGATSIEAWMNPEILKTHKAYTAWLDTLDTDSLKWQQKVFKSKESERMRAVIAAQATAGLKAGVYKPSYKDKDWQKISAPITTEKMKLGGYWGITWLRTSFELPSGSTKQPFLLKGDINAQKVEVWLNGQKVKGDKQVFELPACLLKKQNQLTFRVLIHWGSAFLGTEQKPLKVCSADGSLDLPLMGEWRFNAGLEPALPGWQNYYNTHTVLYNAMIYPLMPYSMRGILWYQGENNTWQSKRYQQLLPTMIEDWRVGFRQGNIPFLIVQLANYMKKKPQPSESAWAEMREAQARTLIYPNTGLATTIDIGEENDIHPKNKKEVGWRLYLQAQRLDYGRNIVASGPTFESMKMEGSKVRIRFTNASNGLMMKGTALVGFAVAGSDRKFHWAKADIQAGEVIVYAQEVAQPIAVRYAWADNPDANLYNVEELPAIPFRTDTWEGITKE